MDLYLEATRSNQTPDDSAEIEVPAMMSTSVDTSKFLPPRTEWVSYYLNSLEPLIQFVTANLRGSAEGKLQFSVPNGTAETLKPIAQQMYAMGDDLKGDLDVLDDIFNQENPSAKQLIDLSARISQDASKLDGLRMRFYEVVRKAEKDGVTERELLPPMRK